jgi:hypothetical protein
MLKQQRESGAAHRSHKKIRAVFYVCHISEYASFIPHAAWVHPMRRFAPRAGRRMPQGHATYETANQFPILSNRRRALSRHLADNPSLRPKIPEAVEAAYGDARAEAYAETGLPETTFPAASPWSFEQAMDDGFWPEAST